MYLKVTQLLCRFYPYVDCKTLLKGEHTIHILLATGKQFKVFMMSMYRVLWHILCTGAVVKVA